MPDELPRLSAELPREHPLRAPLLRVGAESLLRFPLVAAGELIGALLLLDLPELGRIDEVVTTLTPLLPAASLALKNAMAHQRIEKQAQELESQARDLERRVAERTADLETANKAMADSRRAALNMMEDAVAARQRAEEAAALLQCEVAERERTDAALHESNARLSMALEVSNAGIWEWNLKSDKVSLDARFHSLLGYAMGELPTTLNEWLPYHHPDDMPIWTEKATAYMKGESPTYESEHRIRTKAGGWAWVLTRGKLVNLAGSGFPEQFMGISINITERKQAEEALRRAHERLRCFVDANIMGIIVAAASGRVIEANDYYLRLIGYSREEFEQGMVDWRSITPKEWLSADDYAIQELRERGCLHAVREGICPAGRRPDLHPYL